MESLMQMLSRFTGGNDAPVSASADAQKNLLVASGNPGYAEIRRRGEGWTVQTSTLFAPLVAIPTTTARLEIYNNGKRALVVSDLFAMHVLATAVVQTHAIYTMLTTKKAVPTLTALAVNSLSGKGAITPTATSEIVTGVGTTVVNNGWRPWGNLQNFNLAAATPGESWHVPVDGKLIVWPGMSLCVDIAGALATASSFQVGVDFDMVKMALED